MWSCRPSHAIGAVYTGSLPCGGVSHRAVCWPHTITQWDLEGLSCPCEGNLRSIGKELINPKKEDGLEKLRLKCPKCNLRKKPKNRNNYL